MANAGQGEIADPHDIVAPPSLKIMLMMVK